MIYFDERDISRIYGVSLEDNVLKWWRDDKRFSQRFTVRIAESGERLTGKGEMCRDGKTWEDDLSLIYTRIK